MRVAVAGVHARRRHRNVEHPGGRELSLSGIRVGVTSQRKGAELVAALERRGASVLHGPTIGGDVPVPDEHIVADTDAILDASPDWFVASTGVGMRLWAQAADQHGRLEALQAAAGAARCVARGAKALGGLQALRARAVWTSQKQTDADVAGWLRGRVLPGEVVAVQLHGTAAATTFAPVADAGADVLSVETYRHALPDDVGPGLALGDAIVAGELDIVVLTSPGAGRNLVTIAAQRSSDHADALVQALRERVATAVIGPVTSAALDELGIPSWLTPTRSRTGDLLRSLDRWASRRTTAPSHWRPPVQLVPATHAVRCAEGREIALGERGYAVLAALARRPGMVCPPEQLLAEAWGYAAPDDPSAIKHQIARLRRKLDGTGVQIRTVRGVGYRLEGSST
ncbi:uroporphyrinogen-III synthase [Egicoccus halophilus]|uniref:Putative transcriptional regulatory protein n=1 Tax=Egicoccus halophilus TaxID=1670830 RepID=A0A8J3AH95_9ACTN|nr:uroporphyrinogen-III synthase [Egicoccus halophilus]GGI08470.1 putative transcriptional regulatory protein [Egicoccus halophilus]